MFLGIGIGLNNTWREIKIKLIAGYCLHIFKSNIQVDYLTIERYNGADTIDDEKHSTVSN